MDFYLIRQFFILRVSKCGMSIIMANGHIWPLRQMTLGVVGTTDISKWSTMKNQSPHVCSSWVEVDFTPIIKGLNSFISPSEHNPLIR